MSTPIRRQYLEIKQRYPHAIVFFRLGDFYETFDDDAKLCAKELEITLTSKPMGKDLRVPLAGIPYHSVDAYLAKLVTRGYKVAICGQLEDPATAKGIVARDVVRVVTPGTVTEGSLLASDRANYLAAVAAEGDRIGLALADVSAGTFLVTEVTGEGLQAQLAAARPAEIVVADDIEIDGAHGAVTRLDGSWSRYGAAERQVHEHFGVEDVAAFGLVGRRAAVKAAGVLLRYVGENQKAFLPQLTRLSWHDVAAQMALDPHTARNLDVVESDGRTLVSVLDRTRTPMGARLLRSRLVAPSVVLPEITRRLDAVAWFVEDGGRRAATRAVLGRAGDLARLTGRVAAGTATPRELGALRAGLVALPELRAVLGEGGVGDELRVGVRPQEALVDLLQRGLVDEPPATLEHGDAVRPGYSAELDELRLLARDAHQFLADLERTERERTGIKTLKVGYNRVFGYYIEVSHANAAAVPGDYQRRQTLTGAERYITMELKEYETKVLSARDNLEKLEGELFRGLCAAVAEQRAAILETADAVAEIDVAAGLAEAAVAYGYCRPVVDDGERIAIDEGRHPVVERTLAAGEFIANDTRLSREEQVLLITGPNMAGKSTYLRQVALIVLMAQAGSYVPAERAQIGLVDRVFTRIGAHDELAAGRSTFMVEMLETAQILHAATPRSLVILDEVGRGTSTYDGMAIARAVVEYLHNDARVAARTLFATHYHELTELAGILPRVRNLNVQVAEVGGEVVFLRRIVPGGADRSYGVHVARLAGLPHAVVHRAEELLRVLEAGSKPGTAPPPSAAAANGNGPQLSLFGDPSPLEEAVRRLEVDGMTPLEAITALYELKRLGAGDN